MGAWDLGKEMLENDENHDNMASTLPSAAWQGSLWWVLDLKSDGDHRDRGNPRLTYRFSVTQPLTQVHRNPLKLTKVLRYVRV